MDFLADVMVFSEVAREDFGVTDVGQEMDVKAISYPSGCINQVRPGKSTEITMKIPNTYDISFHFFFHKDRNELRLCDDYAFMNRSGDRLVFHLRFIETGFYTFKIYVKSSREDRGPSPNVFNYVIEVVEAGKDVLPFPVPVECYDLEDGFQLNEPSVRFLPCHAEVLFSLWVPEAMRLVAMDSRGRTELVHERDNTWSGKVLTNDPGTELRIGAEFEGETGRIFTTLLIYQVISSELDTMRKQEEVSVETRSIGSSAETRMASATKSLLALPVADHKQAETNTECNKSVCNNERDEEIEELRTELLERIKDRDLDGLQAAVAKAHERDLCADVEDQFLAAQRVIEALYRLEDLRDAVLFMDSAIADEICHHTTPPSLVHDVMVAALLIFGHHEGQTRNGTSCQKLCKISGRNGLKKKIEDFDLFLVHPEIMERAWQIIKDIKQEAVAQISEGASIFYLWVVGMYEEHREIFKDQDTPKPANRRRQKAILSKRAYKK